jgi:hypothetical protein
VTEIRSYRRVFDLERRVYSVDRLRLNPGGVPVRGVVYFLAIVLAGLIAARLPLLGTMAMALPWYLRDIALPGAGATVLSVIRVEGRTFHVAVHALLRYGCGARLLSGAHRRASRGQRWQLGEIVLLPDGSDSRMRALSYTGPGAVLVALEHRRSGRAVEHGSRGLAHRGVRARLTLRQVPRAGLLEPGEVISLSPRVRLRVRPHEPRSGLR